MKTRGAVKLGDGTGSALQQAVARQAVTNTPAHADVTCVCTA